MKKLTVEVPDNYEWDTENYRFKINNEPMIDNANLNDATVGEEFHTNIGEWAKLISTNGPEKNPYIFLIHRIDTHCDITDYFDKNGLSLGYNKKYYIKKK